MPDRVKEKLMELFQQEYDRCQDTLCYECKYYGDDDCGLHGIVDHLIAEGVLLTPETGIGDLSDGYHTFNELYHHRAMLFSVICNLMPERAWKAKKHDDGTMYDGMFIVGIDTPEGQATYHYDLEPYWDVFDVKELERAPVWDGHSPEVAIRRIAGLGCGGADTPVRCKECKSAEPYTRMDGKTGFYCKHQKCTLRYGTNWGRLYMPIKEADDFCSYGERRQGE